MREAESNPKRNVLPTGIKESELVQAIQESGYPLQGMVAGRLAKSFTVTEEWGYIDRDTQEHRSLDVLCYRSLLNDQEAPVQPRLVLLIECKRSVHPYIFFKSVTIQRIPGFPRVAGLPHDRIFVNEQGGPRAIMVSGDLALGLHDLPLVAPGPPKCSAFTKGVPCSGDKVRLSGSDPFNSLILPLVKALEHASKLHAAGPGPKRLYPTFVFCMSVLDAPMILFESPDQVSDPVLTPWVRVVRQEASQNPQSWIPFQFYAVDVVHVDIFERVIYQDLLPSAEEFGRRAIRLNDALFRGGYVPNLDNWTWDQISKKAD